MPGDSAMPAGGRLHGSLAEDPRPLGPRMSSLVSRSVLLDPHAFPSLPSSPSANDDLSAFGSSRALDRLGWPFRLPGGGRLPSMM